jgi:hypothetical protein
LLATPSSGSWRDGECYITAHRLLHDATHATVELVTDLPWELLQHAVWD